MNTKKFLSVCNGIFSILLDFRDLLTNFGLKEHKSVTRCIAVIVMNLVAPKTAYKVVLLLNKTASE
jgi:hypothetical protein